MSFFSEFLRPENDQKLPVEYLAFVLIVLISFVRLVRKNLNP